VAKIQPKKEKIMKRAIIALLILLLMPLSAWSQDIVATWQQEGHTMKLAMRDENHIRMDTTGDNYMLVSGQKVYMVSRQGDGWSVMDMDQLAGMMSRFGAQPKNIDRDADRYHSSFKKTGRTETVAGYKGTVYIAETRDESGKLVDSSEVVFSGDKDIKRVNKAWLTLAMRMGTIIGQQTSREIEEASQKAATAGYGGVLRIGKMTLTKVEKPSLKASYYELPAGAEKMDMMASPNMDTGNDSQAQESSNFVKDLGKDAGSAAQDEVKQNTVDEVKKGVGGLFKKLFK
jgi:hypothetical protein